MLLDFYSYGANIQLIATQFNDTVYQLTIPKQNINELGKYVDNIYALHEKNIYVTGPEHKNMASVTYDMFTMQSQNNYYHGFCDTTITTYGQSASKFAFVIIRNHHDDANDSTQYPQINGIEVICENQSSISIELQNIWIEQFNEILIYGIALDGVSDMNKWLKVMNECSPMKSTDFTVSTNYKNLNSNNFEGIFQHVQLDKLIINFTHTATPVNMEIVIINQNIQQIRGGMTGNLYSN